MKRFPLASAVLAAAITVCGGAFAADAMTLAELEAKYADPSAVVLAVKAPFPTQGGEVRAAVYKNGGDFLDHAILKQHALMDKNGLAVLSFRGLEPGVYAFVAYYDENGDGRLNRGGILGKPKEPVGFSNGFKPKLRKPHFDEVKVDVAPGAVVMLTLDD